MTLDECIRLTLERSPDMLAGLGARVTYFGAVGADADGALVAAALEARGVDLTGLVVRAERATSRTTIEVDATGDRRFVSEDFGACDGYAPDATALAVLEGAGWMPRLGLQYHWCNRDWATFDDYLASLRHKRRKVGRIARPETIQHVAPVAMI